MARKIQADDDAAAEAVRLLMTGLAQGEDVHALAAVIEELHPPRDTFPGEVFLRVSAGALDVAGVSGRNPIPYEGLRETYLGECEFRGRQNSKIQFAILASAAARGGIAPDLLGETGWWQADDFWYYALAAAVGVIRACADRMSLPVPDFIQQLLPALKVEVVAVQAGDAERQV